MMTEAKVGLLFFIGLGVALGFTLFVSDLNVGSGDLVVRFARVQGLGQGDTVLYNGFKVGSVTAIRPDVVDGAPVVAVEFMVEEALRDRVLINDRTVATVDKGMLGGAALSLVTTGKGEPISNQGLERLSGQHPVSLSEAVTNFDRIVEENREDIREAVSFLPNAVRNFSDMSNEIRALIRDNSDNIARAVQEVGDMGAAVERLADENREEIKRAAANIADMGDEITGLVEENRPAIKKAVDQFPETVANINDAADEIKRAVRDNRERIDATMKGLAKLGPKLETIGDDLSVITAQIRSGEGTIGRLIFDDGLHDQAQQVLASAEQRLEEVKPMTSGFSDIRFYLGVSSGYNAERENFTSTVYLRIEPKPWKIYEGGVTWRSAPEGRDTLDEDPEDFNIDLNLLIGWRFFPDEEAESYRLALKAGLIEGQIGGHLNYTLMPHRSWLGLMARGRHDEWNPLDRRYEEGDGVYGRLLLDTRVWKRVFVAVGADDIFDLDETAFYAGLRAEILDMDIRNAVAAQSLLP